MSEFAGISNDTFLADAPLAEELQELSDDPNNLEGVIYDVDEGGDIVAELVTKSGLSLSTNTKTTQLARTRNDGRASYYPLLPNSFGLPSFQSCPGHTEEFCKPFCYGLTSEGRTNVAKNLQGNLELLRDKTELQMYELLSEMMGEYQRLFMKELAKGKLTENDNFFRIHWDGDFFNIEYARAWYRVISENPQTKFWVYTRSFSEPVDVVPIFMEGDKLKNLAFYLSVDIGNIEDAKRQVAKHPKILRAYCGSDPGEAVMLAEEFGVKHYTPCPENFGQMPLALNGHGACAECQLCFKSRPHILFTNTKSPDGSAQPRLFYSETRVELSSKRREAPGFDKSLLGATALGN